MSGWTREFRMTSGETLALSALIFIDSFEE